MLRVVAGTVGGRRLKTPKGVEIRPTQDRIKQVVFSSLSEWVEGAAILDLYSGTGGLALEALSRGASRAVCVEKESRCTSVITENSEICGFSSLTHVIRQDVETFLSHPDGKVFDLVFADPPYQKIRSSLDESPFLGLVRPWVRAGGLFVWEHYSGQHLKEPKGWTIIRDRDYGETGLTFLQPAPA